MTIFNPEILCKSTAQRLTSEKVRDKLVQDGWDPEKRFFMDAMAAERMYWNQKQRPVTVKYEGIPWFRVVKPGTYEKL